jgi:hypothetical protein
MALEKVSSASMNEKRVTILPHIEGKITRDGKVSEPDIYWIMEKWLERHPEIKKGRQDIKISRGVKTLRPGIKTDVISVTIVAGDDIKGYDTAQDADLHEYYLNEERDE